MRSFIWAALAALLVSCISAQEASLEIDEFNGTAAVPFSVCNVRVSYDVGRPSPLVLYPGSTSPVRAANAAGLLSFSGGQNIQLACSGAGNYLTVLGAGAQEAVATCVSGTSFLVAGRSYNYNQLVCRRWPDSVNEVAGSCLWGKTLIHVGFRVAAGFVNAYDVCHDHVAHHTYWTRFVLGRDAAGYQAGIPRPDWYQGQWFQGIDITNLYRRATQRVTFAQLLGSQELGDRYISLTNDYFLSKGHLVAKADFLHGAFHFATFWYLNAAPQWQTFNGNNWNSLEDDVRRFAGRIGRDLHVYTGTYGRADLPDVNGRTTELFLSVSRRAQVPRMFWKILHDPTTNAGIAFVGLNNPYQSPASIPADVRCRDISSSISWLTWRQTDVVRGYSYACEVNDFRANFPDIPAFTVTSILR